MMEVVWVIPRIGVLQVCSKLDVDLGAAISGALHRLHDTNPFHLVRVELEAYRREGVHNPPVLALRLRHAAVPTHSC